jgi:hypothetical protein
MMMLAAAAGFYALGTLLAIIAYATFSGDTLSSYHTFRDLARASDWLHFVGVLIAFGAVCKVGWETMAARVADQQAELAVAAVATLLAAIAALVNAASERSTATADILMAVGTGIWGLLALSRAVRLNLAAQETPGPASPLATLWLAAAGGLVLIAVGSGFDVGLTDQGLGIAVGILEAIGFCLLAWALLSARTRGLMGGLPTGSVVQALGLLALAGVTAAVVAGLVFTPHGTLKGLRIGSSIVYTVRLVGVVILGWAAWRRLGEIVSGRPAVPRQGGSGWAWHGQGGQAPAAPVPPPETSLVPPPGPAGAAPTESFTPQVGEAPPPPPNVPPE